jgi:DNA-binding CsgD family transcriptional regulator
MSAAVAAPDLYERATALIEQLFEAPTSATAWSRFLGAVCREMSTDAVAILVGQVDVERPPMMLAHGIDLRGISAEIILPMGPQPSEHEVPALRVVEIPAASESFARLRIYQHVLSKAGVPPGPGFSVVIGRNPQQITGALLVMSRDPSWQPKAEDRALLELLAPYVRRAIGVGLRLQERTTDVEMLLGLFDTLALGVVLLDDKSRVTFANRSAAEILGAPGGGAPPEGEGMEELRDRRTAALRVLLRSQTLGAQRSALAYPHPEDGRPLQIVSTPLRWPDAGAGVAARFTAALFLGDPGSSTRDAVEGLGALYGLTAAEERLASLLASGATLAEAAEKLSIRMSTARGVLKSVFSKTGTRRQASLVSLILAAPGQLRAARARGLGRGRPGQS